MQIQLTKKNKTKTCVLLAVYKECREKCQEGLNILLLPLCS